MERFLALLRGINISGKNQIAMPELKAACTDAGLLDVRTYLNSGNVLFTADSDDPDALAAAISDLIRRQFALEIPVCVIALESLKTLLSKAPDWWGAHDSAQYSNLIFVLPPVTAAETAEKIGAPTDGLEQVQICENVIFWTFDRKQYAKANWWRKTARAGIGEALTIRTANTLRRLAGM